MHLFCARTYITNTCTCTCAVGVQSAIQIFTKLPVVQLATTARALKFQMVEVVVRVRTVLVPVRAICNL